MEKNMTGYPSIDKPWMSYYNNELVIKTVFPNTTLYEYIFQNNREHLSEDALIYFTKHVSYQELFYESDRIASILSAHGIKENGSVMLCITGTPEAVELLMACSKLGACAVMINPTLTVEQISATMRECQSKILFCMDALYNAIAPAIAEADVKQVVIVPAVQSLSVAVRLFEKAKSCFKSSPKIPYDDKRLKIWSEFLKGEKSEVHPPKCGGDLPLAIVFTSGSTGRPKGIVHTNNSYSALAVEYSVSGYPIERGYRYLNILPFFVAAALSYELFAPIALGMPVVIDPVYKASSFAKDIIKYKPVVAAATKSFWYEAMERRDFQKANLSFLIGPIQGGEPLYAYDEKKINDFLLERRCPATLYTGWGMSETNSTITTTMSEGNSAGSTGVPFPHVVVAAFDLDSGEECKYNCYGGLQVLSPCTMKEYFANKEATDKFFRVDKYGNRWCITGDVGYINERGEVFVMGRASESYRSDDGKRVYLFEIENVITLDPDVVRCKVTTFLQNESIVPAAHLILKDEAGSEKEEILERIKSLCEEKLSPDALPVKYIIHKDFPVTPTGKIDVRALISESE